MNDLICSNCGIRTVNGNWGFCDECEQELYREDHPVWYRSDALQMLKDGIIDEQDLVGAEIIDDPEGI